MEKITEFQNYLKNEKHSSSSTSTAYVSDINEFEAFLKTQRDKTLSRAANADVVAYLDNLKSLGKSGATVNRKLASVRAYYNFLIEKGSMSSNPTSHIKSPRIARKDVEYLSIEEVELLLSSPDDSAKGLRDRAILEIMYATGMRANEVASAQISDINLQIGFISCSSETKTRIIPIGRPARAALSEYLEHSRASLLGTKKDSGALFLNYAGVRMTRQGIWKILKYYSEKTGLEHKFSPQILRNSFAAHMIQNGADLKSLQELLGHEDIMATKIFLSVTKNRIMDVYDRTHPRA